MQQLSLRPGTPAAPSLAGDLPRGSGPGLAWHPPPPVPLSRQDPRGCSRWRNRRQSADDTCFSICCQLCPPVHNKKFPLSVGAPAWLSLPRPSLQGESNSIRSCFSIWQCSPFARGCLAQAAAGVCHPWVQAGCAWPGQPRRELCVRQLLCRLLGSFLIFTSTTDTRPCVASPLLRSDCRPAAHAAS